MNNFPNLFLEIKKLSMSLIASAMVTILGASLGGLYIATQVSVGVLIVIMSCYFYAFFAWSSIVKKNIAWMGPIIVIKYSILIITIYYVWTHFDVFYVIVGLMAQLLFLGIFLALLKAQEIRRIKKGQ